MLLVVDRHRFAELLDQVALLLAELLWRGHADFDDQVAFASFVQVRHAFAA